MNAAFGRVDIAPILFVSSNPSIGDDKHATGAAKDEDVWDSHHFAHGSGCRPYILEFVATVVHF